MEDVQVYSPSLLFRFVGTGTTQRAWTFLIVSVGVVACSCSSASFYHNQLHCHVQLLLQEVFVIVYMSF